MPSRRSVSRWEGLPKVWEGLPKVWEALPEAWKRSGAPPGGQEGVGRHSWRSARGRGALQEFLDGSEGPP